MFVRRGLLKNDKNEHGVEGNTHTNICFKSTRVFTDHEIIYCIQEKVTLVITMCPQNQNCGFMRFYVPYYIGSEEKVSPIKKMF